MDWKEETKEFYERFAEKYDGVKDEDFVDNYLSKDFDLFVQNLPSKAVLDLGSGPGNDSLKFKENGLESVCVDISKSMVNLCKSKDLKAEQMDFESLDFEKNSFDGVWSRTSLLHLPKSRIREVLKQIREILKPKGILYLMMKEGDFEGLKESSEFPESERYFALYRKEELEEILSEFFEIFYFSWTEIDEDHVYLNFICRKN